MHVPHVDNCGKKGGTSVDFIGRLGASLPFTSHFGIMCLPKCTFHISYSAKAALPVARKINVLNYPSLNAEISKAVHSHPLT